MILEENNYARYHSYVIKHCYDHNNAAAAQPHNYIQILIMLTHPTTTLSFQEISESTHRLPIFSRVNQNLRLVSTHLKLIILDLIVLIDTIEQAN